MDNDTKFQIKINDKGEAVIDLYEWFSYHLTDEQKEALEPVWWNIAYELMGDMLKEEYSSSSYNSKIHDLRVAFLQSEEAPQVFRDVVSTLMHNIDIAVEDANRYRDAYWQLWYAWPNGLTSNRPHNPGWMPVPIPSPEEVTAKIEEITGKQKAGE